MPTSISTFFRSRTAQLPSQPNTGFRCLFTKPLALAALLASASVANAATYTIQIGAFKTPSTQYAQPARAVGDVYATQRDNGVIALSVGSFASSADAASALSRIADNYPGAFVRRANPDARRSFTQGAASGSQRSAYAQSGSAKSDSPARVPAPPTGDSSGELATLTASERKNVVYLDGVLHFKQGNEFLPLTEYRARNR